MTTATKIPGFVSQRDFQKADKDYLKNERQNGKFSDPVSIEFVAAGGEKGRKGEYLVKQQFEKLGYKVRLLDGYDRADLRVLIGDEWKYVEVKTATQSGVSDSFTFSNIKTSNFDIIALVMVGYDYTSVVIGGKSAKRFIDVYGTRTDRGETLYFNKYRSHRLLKGAERFLSITQKNIQKILNDS